MKLQNRRSRFKRITPGVVIGFVAFVLFPKLDYNSLEDGIKSGFFLSHIYSVIYTFNNGDFFTL